MDYDNDELPRQARDKNEKSCQQNTRVRFLAGEIVSSLLGVSGVRLYHDNALSRCPGSERTRWHCDDGPDAHMVMADSEVVTVWIPLQRYAKRCFSEPLF